MSPHRRARQIPHPVLSALGDLVAILARPVWAAADLPRHLRRRWQRVLRWAADDPDKAGYVLTVTVYLTLLTVVTVAALIGGIE